MSLSSRHYDASPPAQRFRRTAGAAPVGAVSGILYVEASYPAVAKTENMSDRLVLEPVGLPLERFSVEIVDGLPDLRRDREVLGDFSDEEAGQLIALLTRLIANLDRIASAEASPD